MEILGWMVSERVIDIPSGLVRALARQSSPLIAPRHQEKAGGCRPRDQPRMRMSLKSQDSWSCRTPCWHYGNEVEELRESFHRVDEVVASSLAEERCVGIQTDLQADCKATVMLSRIDPNGQ